MANRFLNNDPEVFKIKMEEDEVKELNYLTEKQDHEKFSGISLSDNEQYKKKYKSPLTITEKLCGSASTKSSSTLAILNPSVGEKYQAPQLCLYLSLS